MIVKADEPPELLKRCLMHVARYVDGLFITITQEQRVEALEQVINAYQKDKFVDVSYTKWEDDFGKARNFNLDRIPKDYGANTSGRD